MINPAARIREKMRRIPPWFGTIRLPVRYDSIIARGQAAVASRVPSSQIGVFSGHRKGGIRRHCFGAIKRLRISGRNRPNNGVSPSPEYRFFVPLSPPSPPECKPEQSEQEQEVEAHRATTSSTTSIIAFGGKGRGFKCRHRGGDPSQHLGLPGDRVSRHPPHRLCPGGGWKNSSIPVSSGICGEICRMPISPGKGCSRALPGTNPWKGCPRNSRVTTGVEIHSHGDRVGIPGR